MLKKDYPATWGLRANSGVCFGFLDVAQIFLTENAVLENTVISLARVTNQANVLIRSQLVLNDDARITFSVVSNQFSKLRGG